MKDHRDHIEAEAPLPTGTHPLDESLQEFVEGALAPSEATSIQEHVDACPRCAAEVAGWRELFAELSDLPELEPSPAFRRRVLADLPPTPSPLHRLLVRLSPFRGSRRARKTQHTPPDLIQDYLEGLLAPAARNRVAGHLESCETCRSDVLSWSALFASLDSLPRVAPSASFAERVISQVRVTDTARVVGQRGWVAAAVSAVENLPGRAAKVLPSTRLGWGLLCSFLALPAAGVAAALGLVVLHPLLSVGSLATFILWRGTDLLQTALTQGWERLVGSPFAYQLWSMVEGAAASPSLAVGLLLSLWLTSLLAGWVLYRNVVAPIHMVNRNV